jgi:putative tricarboxylic transport membrane protein
MSEARKNAFIEIIVALLLAALAFVFFISTLDLPAPRREPLGSAAMPQVVCGCILLFCGIIAFRAVRILRAERPVADSPQPRPAGHRRRVDLAVKLLGLTLVFIAVLQTRLVPNEILTPVFLMASMLMLNDFRRSAWFPSLLLAVGLGLLTDHLFTEFFYIDLP